MRQGLLAGLIVVAFGLPLAVLADGKEFVREYGALRAAIGGDTGPFKAIWMKPAADALPAPKNDELAAILQSGAQQLAEQRAHPDTVRTRAVAQSAFMIDMQRLVFAAKDPLEADRVSRQLMSVRGTALATVASLKDGDIPTFPDAEDGLAHWQLGALVDQFSIAANAEEQPALQGPPTATPDAPIQMAADRTGGGEDAANVAPESTPFTIVASAGENAAANSSGFVDIVQTHLANSVGALPIPASVPGFIDLGITSK